MKGWVGRVGWPIADNLVFTHISGHPSATGRAQDRESSPAKDRRSSTVPSNRVKCRRSNAASEKRRLSADDSRRREVTRVAQMDVARRRCGTQQRWLTPRPTDWQTDRLNRSTSAVTLNSTSLVRTTTTCDNYVHSASYCGLRFKSDIGRLLDPRFEYCNLVWNNYLSNVSAQLLASVSVLKDFLLFRDKPELSSDMFNTDDITCFITVLCTGWSPESFCHLDLFLFLFCVCISVFCVCICVLFTCTLCTI